MPRSGSTFLSRSLQKMTGFPEHYLAQTYTNIEQRLDIPSLMMYLAATQLLSTIIEANEPNINLMNTFVIRPIVVY